MINILKGKNSEEVAKLSSKIIIDVLKANPKATLGLATGSSPLGLYAELVGACKGGEISFREVKTLNLDEYVGLDGENDQSYRYFMNTNLFSKVDIDLANTNVPDGLASDPKAECERYDALVESFGGVDVQVLGIGNNGHIGFNEPDSVFPYGTSLINLTESTIDANSRFFASRDLVPTQAISMGIGHILTAKAIILIALGKGKAEILEKALFGDITPEVPASALRLYNGPVYVCADTDALSVIAEKHPEAIN